MQWTPNYIGEPPPDWEPSAPAKLRFECLCGRLSGLIDGPMGPHKMTGGTHANFLLVLLKFVKFDRLGSLKHFDYDDPRGYMPLTTIYRCGKCGTPILSFRDDGEPTVAHVFVGCLKDMSCLESHQPDKELHERERLPWLPALAKPPTPSEAASPPQNPDLEMASSEPDVEMMDSLSLND
ncbi:hypothetical protein F4818DRAFT_435771 [Hypoxylon cercidicola]|nr:hypothetical protein F4818DRAFT_435771 [Hypoxylon cercidicola]